jgi:hypothetical protein
MLQKPEQVGYNGVSRRQILKALGVGMGTITVGTLMGCTSLVDRVARSSNGTERFIPLSKEQQLANAFAKADKKSLKKAAKALKKIQDDYKQDGDLYSSISRARKVLERVFNHYNSIGLTNALEAYTVRLALETYNDLDPETIQALRDEGLTEEEIQQSHSLVLQARERLLPIASTLHVPQILDDIITKMKRAEKKRKKSQSLSTIHDLKMVPAAQWVSCIMSIFQLIAASILLAAACSACPTPTAPLSCYLCAAAISAYMAAYLDYYMECGDALNLW